MKGCNMNKWILALIIAVCGVAEVSTAAEDVKISGSRIWISSMTDGAKTKLDAITEKEAKTILIKKTCSQADFAAICQLGWIRKLEFDSGNENINDLSPLANLKGLRKLKLRLFKTSKNAPIDVAPIAQLKSLIDVEFYSARVTSTNVLAGLSKLRRVSMHMTSVDSIDFLKGTPEIRELNLYGRGHTFKNYEPLLGLKKLRILNIYMNPQATDKLLAPLSAITSLREIRMSNSRKITTLDFLANCKDMRSINANWCSLLTDISALANMDQLQSVSISDSKISSISPFKDNKQLTSLNISKTAVSDISPLSGCSKLQTLDIEKTKVKDLSPLSGCIELQTINISETPISDLSVLVNYDNLRSLEVSKTVSQDQIDKLKEVFLDIRIRQSK
jgi:internalin A